MAVTMSVAGRMKQTPATRGAQSAAVAACMAIDSKKAVQDIDVKNLQMILKPGM